MTHKQVYEQFRLYFPQYAEKAKLYFPNGKNSVRVRLNDQKEFIFTYHDSRNWSFETVDNHVDRMKGNIKK